MNRTDFCPFCGIDLQRTIKWEFCYKCKKELPEEYQKFPYEKLKNILSIIALPITIPISIPVLLFVYINWYIYGGGEFYDFIRCKRNIK